MLLMVLSALVGTKGDIAFAGSLQALRTLRDEYINLDTVRVQGLPGYFTGWSSL
jgi:hypothetical protein